MTLWAQRLAITGGGRHGERRGEKSISWNLTTLNEAKRKKEGDHLSLYDETYHRWNKKKE